MGSFSTTPKNPPTSPIKANTTTDGAVADKPTLYMPTKVLPSPENLQASSTRRLSRIEVQKAITDVKRFVEARLESDFHLIRVSMIETNPKR